MKIKKIHKLIISVAIFVVAFVLVGFFSYKIYKACTSDQTTKNGYSSRIVRSNNNGEFVIPELGLAFTLPDMFKAVKLGIQRHDGSVFYEGTQDPMLLGSSFRARGVDDNKVDLDGFIFCGASLDNQEPRGSFFCDIAYIKIHNRFVDYSGRLPTAINAPSVATKPATIYKIEGGSVAVVSKRELPDRSDLGPLDDSDYDKYTEVYIPLKGKEFPAAIVQVDIEKVTEEELTQFIKSIRIFEVQK